MSANSKIEWTHHTFNPWRGCTKVSAGCANCYAETLSKRNPRSLGVWGDNGTRVVASETYWREPEKWERSAEKAGERHRVFCASLADVCEDRRDVIEARLRLKQLIIDTRHLDWLLLTKRPEQFLRLFWGPQWWPSNVWAGTSVENQQAADERIPHLLKCPAAVRFLSVEPMLGPVNLFATKAGNHGRDCTDEGWSELRGIHWVIVGGESGNGAREFNVDWAYDVMLQCRAAGVPFFFKQMGARPVTTNVNAHDWPDCTGFGDWGDMVASARIRLNDPKGGDIAEWPEDLRIREFPKVVQPC